MPPVFFETEDTKVRPCGAVLATGAAVQVVMFEEVVQVTAAFEAGLRTVDVLTRVVTVPPEESVAGAAMPLVVNTVELVVVARSFTVVMVPV